MHEQQRILDVYKDRDHSVNLSYYGFESLAHLLRVQQRHQQTVKLLKKHGIPSLENKKIVDIGCGDGVMLRSFIEWGALMKNLAGLDLRPNAIEFAKYVNPDLDVYTGSATKLPWEDSSFDIVCQHTMFTSILDMKMKKQIASEMKRVLTKDGIILWYDYFYNNPKNQNVGGVTAKEISLLFAEFDIDLKKVTLAPPIARQIPDILLPAIYPMLSTISLLRTHYLGVFSRVKK